MGRPMCGERKNLLIQAHWWSVVGVVSWPGLLEQSYLSLLNSEDYINTSSANLQRHASNRNRKNIIQEDNDSKHTANTTKDLIAGEIKSF